MIFSNLQDGLFVFPVLESRKTVLREGCTSFSGKGPKFVIFSRDTALLERSGKISNEHKEKL
jgi:hypothetical protein